MLEDLVEGRARRGVVAQQAADEVARRRRHAARHAVLVVRDAHIRLLQRRRLERRSADQQRVPVQWKKMRTLDSATD